MEKITFFIGILLLCIIGVAVYLFYLISEEKKDGSVTGGAKATKKVSDKKSNFFKKNNNSIVREKAVKKDTNIDYSSDIDELLKPDTTHISDITEEQEVLRNFARRRLDESNVSSEFNADKIFFYNSILKNTPKSLKEFYSALNSATGDSFKKELKYAIINDVKLLRSLSKKEDARKLLKFFSNNAADISDKYMLAVFKDDNSARRSIASDACARALNEFLDNRNNLSVPAKKIILILSFEVLSSNTTEDFSTDERSLLGFISEIL